MATLFFDDAGSDRFTSPGLGVSFTPSFTEFCAGARDRDFYDHQDMHSRATNVEHADTGPSRADIYRAAGLSRLV